MVQKVEVLLVDDLTGETADESVSFTLDGVEYEIDLSKENATRLREQLAPFQQAARRTASRRGGRSGSRPRRTASTGPSTREIRDWAKGQGIEVNQRGRIPAGVRVKFEEGTGS